MAVENTHIQRKEWHIRVARGAHWTGTWKDAGQLLRTDFFDPSTLKELD